MTIVDAHCHIASLDFIPRSFIDASLANMAVLLSARGVPATPSKLWSMYEPRMQDPTCDELVAEMAAAGISRAVLLAADFSYALKDCTLTVEESFERHRDVLRRHPGKFEVFGGVDPRWGADGVALFERSLTELGFRGFKVYPPCGFSPSARELFPYYELCAQHRVPVLLHVGPTSPALSFETTNPFLVDEAARRFPGVNFVLAHGAVNFPAECAMLCRFRPNVYLDLSAFQTALAWDPPDGALRAIVSQGINHKILFGTDWPVFRMQGRQAEFAEAVFGAAGALAALGETDRALIAHRNAERLLGSQVPQARRDDVDARLQHR